MLEYDRQFNERTHSLNRLLSIKRLTVLARKQREKAIEKSFVCSNNNASEKEKKRNRIFIFTLLLYVAGCGHSVSIKTVSIINFIYFT